MFAIQEDQIAVFATQAKEQFEDRLVAHVRDKFPMKYSRFGEMRTRAHVRRKTAEAREYGWETERQIASFIDLGLRFGKFADAEWAQEGLDTDSGPPDARMRKLKRAALASNPGVLQ